RFSLFFYSFPLFSILSLSFAHTSLSLSLSHSHSPSISSSWCRSGRPFYPDLHCLFSFSTAHIRSVRLLVLSLLSEENNTIYFNSRFASPSPFLFLVSSASRLVFIFFFPSVLSFLSSLPTSHLSFFSSYFSPLFLLFLLLTSHSLHHTPALYHTHSFFSSTHFNNLRSPLLPAETHTPDKGWTGTMSDILSVPTLGLANNYNNNRNNTEQRRRQENPAPLHTTLSSSSSSSSPAPRVTFPTNVAPSPPSTIRRNAATTTARSASLASTTGQPSPSSPAPSYPDSHSPRHSSISSSTLATATTMSTTSGTTTGTGAAAAGALVRIEDASPIILFTLQYSVAVVQGVTIFILSAVFSIVQLVSGHLNDTPQSPPSSGSGTTTGGTMVGRRRNVAGGGSDDERRRQRRRRWSGSGTGNSSSTSATTWAQNLIEHTTTKEDSIRPQSSHASGQQEHAGTEGGGGTGGTLAQRVEVLRFLGSTIATLVGGYTTSFGTSSMFSSASGGEVEGIDPTKVAGGGGGTTVPGVPTGGEMNYSSRIRRALAKTLSGHALPIPRSIKRVTFNDTVQFHTTTGRSRTRFNSNEEDEEEEEDGASSSPVSKFFSSGFSASAAGMSHEEPMSSSPLPATPIATDASGMKGQRKTRPPSIMPPARDRKQLQEQDDLEAQGSPGVRATGISVVSNGRSIPVSTATMTSGTGTSTAAKKLVSTITIALPPLSRPRKQQQQQQQQQQPISPVMTIVATSTTTAAGAATTSTTTTNMISTPTPTSYSPAIGSGSGGRAGLASALLSSLMMPAAPAPISDAARSLLTSASSPTTSPTSTAGENSAAILSDSDSSKSSGRGRGGSLRRTGSGSVPSKISTFLRQHRLPRQQQQQQQQQQQPSQMQGQGLFGPGEYTSSPISAVSSTGLTVDVRKANSGRTIPTAPSTAPLPSTSGTYTTPTSPTPSSIMRQRSLYSIHSTVSSTVSSAVAAVIGTEPPPSVPTSLTTSMALFLSSANSTDAVNPLLSPRLGPMGGTKYQHQRKRSASVDLSGMVSTTMAAMMVSGMNGRDVPPSPGVPTTSESAPMDSGGRSLMYKLTHPQRYKRELGLQQQQLQQHQQQCRDTNSLSSATSSPSASQVALPSTFSTTSVASITSTSSTGSGILQHERPPFRPSPGSGSGSSSASGMISPTKVVYPFSRSFSDLPASLSYLSDDPPPTPSLPSSFFPATMTVESLPSPTLSPSLSPAATTTNVAVTGEIYQPQPHPATPITATNPVSSSSSSSGAEKKKEATPLKESTTPPLSLFFPSPTTQHRPLPSPLLSPSLPSSAAMVLSNVKGSLSQQLRRSPSPRSNGGEGRRSKSSSSSSSSPMMEDKSSHDVHTTTFAACGFSVSASSSSSSSS
ncbi:MAG: hypothetical protein J3R72DRAFT_161795, partial [Linnemannia gamsii]